MRFCATILAAALGLVLGAAGIVRADSCTSPLACTNGSWTLPSLGFNLLATGSNTTAAMTVGAGGSIATTSTGTNQATSVTGTSSNGLNAVTLNDNTAESVAAPGASKSNAFPEVAHWFARHGASGAKIPFVYEPASTTTGDLFLGTTTKGEPTRLAAGATNLPLLGQGAGVNPAYKSAILYVHRTNDSSSITSTTLADDTTGTGGGLQLTLAASTNYRVTALVYATTATASDIQVALNLPGTATGSVFGLACGYTLFNTGTVGSTGPICARLTVDNTAETIAGPAGDLYITITADVTNVTAGTLSFAWALAAGSSATLVKANSWMMAEIHQ